MLFCSNLVLQILGFGYRMALSRLACASALGLNSLVMQLYGLVVSLSISGLNVALTAISARIKPDEVRTLLRTGELLFVILWFTAAMPFIFFSRSIAVCLLGDGSAFSALLLMLFCIFMTGIENILKSVHIGTGSVISCAVSELTEQGVRFLLVILLLRSAAHDTDSEAVFLIMLGMVFSEFVSVSFLSASFKRLFPNGRKRFDRVLFKRIFSLTFPAALTALSSNLFSSASALLLPSCLLKYGISRNEALSGIGIINTSAIPISMLPMAFMGALAAVIMPEISARSAQGRDFSRLIKKAFLYSSALGAVSAVLICLFGRNIAIISFGIAPSETVFILIELKALFLYVHAVSTAVLNGQMRQRAVLLIAVCSEVFGLILMVLLVPVLGFVGYCFSLVLCEALRLILNLSALSFGIKKVWQRTATYDKICLDKI